ncbi:MULTISPECIES: hypothetical protein [Mumia]|uniref:hypothetical protein n=1 Tax=Mumia TaxID=1546255 RepID=UPI001AB05CFB|nr:MULTISPECIES: hypothetical protein [unclassified Mumia]
MRRRYGETYRIVRAESGARALEALKELRLRGEEVAVILADHRMPQMTGIEDCDDAGLHVGRRRQAVLAARPRAVRPYRRARADRRDAGDLTVESEPGDTRFTVRIPYDAPAM